MNTEYTDLKEIEVNQVEVEDATLSSRLIDETPIAYDDAIQDEILEMLPVCKKTKDLLRNYRREGLKKIKDTCDNPFDDESNLTPTENKII